MEHFQYKHPSQIINETMLIKLLEVKYSKCFIPSDDPGFQVELLGDDEKLLFFWSNTKSDRHYKVYKIDFFKETATLTFLKPIGDIRVDKTMLRNVFHELDDVKIRITIYDSYALERIETIFTKLECPVCPVFMLQRVFSATCGHSVCESCSFRLQTCPLCKFPYRSRNHRVFDIRNYALEQFRDDVLKP